MDFPSPVNSPMEARIATSAAPDAHAITKRREYSRARSRSAPSAASTATDMATTMSMVLGARKNLVPGTSSYTR